MVGISAAFYLGLAVLGIGGLAAYASHPALIALAAVFFGLTASALFTSGGNCSPGVREDRSNRWVLWAFSIVGIVGGFLPAWTDRIGFATIDGEATRWIGVVILAIGGSLRIAPVFVLGHRFSGLVAIQAEHQLVTTGLYRVIRNPSYLGLLISMVGWGLAFRSVVGVLLTALMVPIIVARIQSEEALLHSNFGAEYDAYRARTWRLIPGVY